MPVGLIGRVLLTVHAEAVAGTQLVRATALCGITVLRAGQPAGILVTVAIVTFGHSASNEPRKGAGQGELEGAKG